MLRSGVESPSYSNIVTGQTAIIGAAAAVPYGGPLTPGKVILTNGSDTTIYYGPAGVNASTGVPLPAGTTREVFSANVYVFCAGSKTLAYEHYS